MKFMYDWLSELATTLHEAREVPCDNARLQAAIASNVHGTIDDIPPAKKDDLLIPIDTVAGDNTRKRHAATKRSGRKLQQPLLEHFLTLEAA